MLLCFKEMQDKDFLGDFGIRGFTIGRGIFFTI